MKTGMWIIWLLTTAILILGFAAPMKYSRS